jgi:glutamine synthetase
MNDKKFNLGSNKIVQFIKKDPNNFTIADIIKFIKKNDIKMLNFNYIGGDNKLKTLSFSIRDEKQIKQLLEWGERVDGSSLFSYINPSNSDLYIIPRLKTVFINPFSPIPAINILCSYFDDSGNELAIAPEYIVKKAHQELIKSTGVSLQVLGELEYYVIYERQENGLFIDSSKKNYQQSKPFVKYEDMNNEILQILTSIGAKVKYGHSEVGSIILENDKILEQYEIEFDLETLEDMAYHLVIGKWIIRNIAARYGIEVTFAPKIAVGYAGSGLHIHITAIKKGKNILFDNNKTLSKDAKKIIGGLVKLAPSITAFGNTNPTSYLRLVPNQEAPTTISWGEKNRLVLIRVPLGWRKTTHMSSIINQNVTKSSYGEQNQTIELRSPDGSANIHLLLAGIAVAAKFGLTNNESLKLAEEKHVDFDMLKKENKKSLKKFEHLPKSCYESAEKLKEHADIYQSDGVFNKRIIEGLINQLKSFNDKNLNYELKRDKKKAEKYIRDFIHCG